MAKTYRTRIPKQFRIPRPMASQPVASRFGWLRLDVLALAAGTLLAAVAPLRRLDDAARGLTLGALTDAAPSTHALLVTAAPEDLRANLCQRALRPLLERGGGRGALLLPPADAFCGGPDDVDDDVLIDLGNLAPERAPAEIPVVPFPLEDGLYGLHPDPKDDFGVQLGAMATRGERGALIMSLDSLMRMSSNPFFPYMLERIDQLEQRLRQFER